MSIYDKVKTLIDKEEPEEQEEEKQKPKIEQPPFYKRPSAWLAGLGSLLLLKIIFGGEKRYTVRGAMFLTKDFRTREFLKSSDIQELHEYQFTKSELSNLQLVASVLQHFRDDTNAPIIISSGGRPPYMKAKEGKYKGMTFVEILRAKHYSPSEFSQHMDFSAADFTTKDKRWLIDIMKLITTKYYSELGKTITQAILYIQDGKPDFIHLGVNSDINDFMKITAGKRLLLAEVKTFIKDDGTRSKSTNFFQYTDKKLSELLRV